MDYRELFYHAVSDSKSSFADFMRTQCQKKLHTELKDKPELWDVLYPKYAPGCKRSVISDDYYPALGRPNVRLETRPISRITPTGIQVAKDSFAYPASFDREAPTEEEYDVIILATGFRALEFLHPIRITGAHGRALSDTWESGAYALYGMTVPTLPNFAMLYGPNTNLGHNSLIVIIEAASRYLSEMIGCVLAARRQGKTVTFTPKEQVTAEYNKTLHDRLNNSSFADPECNSWYRNAEGVITNNYSGTAIEYQKLLSEVKWDDYNVEGDGVEVVRRKGETTSLGRVVEETVVPDAVWLGLSALSAAAVVGGVAMRYLPRLRVR